MPYTDTLGCCIYSGGYLSLRGPDYQFHLFFSNWRNLLADTAIEVGTYTVSGDSLRFMPRSANYPLSLYGAVRTADTVTLKLGGDGPGAADQFPARLTK